MYAACQAAQMLELPQHIKAVVREGGLTENGSNTEAHQHHEQKHGIRKDTTLGAGPQAQQPHQHSQHACVFTAMGKPQWEDAQIYDA
jgi:hypothetical protein